MTDTFDGIGPRMRAQLEEARATPAPAPLTLVSVAGGRVVYYRGIPCYLSRDTDLLTSQGNAALLTGEVA